MGKFRLAAIMLSLAASACATTDRARPVAGQAPDLSPVELIARSAELDGRIVTVSGYFTGGVDTRALWQSKKAWFDVKYWRHGHDYDYWTQCITLYNASDDINLQRLPDGPMRMTGKVFTEQGLWSCNAVSLAVTSVSKR